MPTSAAVYHSTNVHIHNPIHRYAHIDRLTSVSPQVGGSYARLPPRPPVELNKTDEKFWIISFHIHTVSHIHTVIN